MGDRTMDKQILEQFAIPQRNAGEKWSDFIFRTLYQNIMDLTLYPGMPLNEPILADRFGCSRTPVREAFFRLQDNYLVDIFPQCGIFVTPIDYHIIREMQFMRAAVESQIIAGLCQDIAPEYLARISANLTLQENIDQVDSSGKSFFPIDKSFHELFYEAAHYPLVQDIMGRSITHNDRLTYLLILQGLPYQKRSLAEHKELFECIVRHDQKQGIQIIYQHRMEYKNIPPVKGFEHYFRNAD